MNFVNFIYFQTACGCQRMVPATPRWGPEPMINVPLSFPLAVHDWINDPTDDSIKPHIAVRRFRLEREEVLEDGFTRIFTYRETEG